MSLINQVLKDLDKRGASTNIGEATLRVVHNGNQRSAFLLVAAGAAGMLVVAAAAWMVWNAQLKPDAPVVAAVAPPQTVESRPVEVLPASQPVIAPVQVTLPKIDSVSPDPVMATGIAQTLIISGSNFREGASVTLRNQAGRVFANRPIISLSPGQIVLRSKFGKVPNSWSVEVLNPEGVSSGPYTITVKAPAAVTPPAAIPPAVASNPTVAPQSSKATPSGNKTMPSGKTKPVSLMPGVVEAEGVSKQPTQISLQQQADNEFRRAYQLMRQGRNSEALAGYEAALLLDAGHELARQSMVSLLLEKKRNTDAERALQEGLQNNPQQATFAMLLARLQVERNALPLALETLLHTLPYAEKQPDYLAFVAALQQRQNRHKEAIDYYQKALQLKPQAGVWLMGMGISLRAEQRNADAREAFKRALDSNTLSAELQSFVTQQLKEL
jgi:MSHA biogenesis protein MshN